MWGGVGGVGGCRFGPETHLWLSPKLGFDRERQPHTRERHSTTGCKWTAGVIRSNDLVRKKDPGISVFAFLLKENCWPNEFAAVENPNLPSCNEKAQHQHYHESLLPRPERLFLCHQKLLLHFFTFMMLLNLGTT